MSFWYRSLSPIERKTFWGAFLGWALDAVDVQMFSLAIPAIIATFAVDRAQAGLAGGATLIASAIGGLVIGAVSDRSGRVRALQITIVWFSAFTFLSAFAQSYTQFVVVKAFQGFGFGGEWAAGAVLMAETIRPEHRGRAMGTVQSAWAVGWGGAVLLYSALFSLVPPETAWRAMFALGILPALLTVYVRRAIPEPPLYVAAKQHEARWQSTILAIFHPSVLRMTLIGGAIGVGAHGGYYALMTWLPTFLKTERKLSVLGTSGYLAVIIVAFWAGCIASAYLLDRIGRRRNLALFSVCCVLTVLVYQLVPLSNAQMLVVGFPLGFFAAGIPASLGALFNELYPSGIRGTGVGFCYNFGRIVSGAFPWLVGHMSESMPLGRAIGIDAALAYGLVVVCVVALPETKGKRLDAQDESLKRTSAA